MALVASVAVTVKVDEPAAVGVPESKPVLESDRPAGSVPVVTANVIGAVPPLVAICWL